MTLLNPFLLSILHGGIKLKDEAPKLLDQELYHDHWPEGPSKVWAATWNGNSEDASDYQEDHTSDVYLVRDAC